MTTTIEQVFIDELITATREVFQTMVFSEVHPANPVNNDAALRSGRNVVGTIAFTGKTSGLVVFYSTLDVATQITALMLGMEPKDVTGELPDAIGELTNMVGGSFRTRMAHVHGEAWAISVPTVTVGSDFYTKFVSDVQRVLCPFKLGDGEVFVELIVTRRTS
jgi:chemotaxis protein CheX